jgi:hypothetical protein
MEFNSLVMYCGPVTSARLNMKDFVNTPQRTAAVIRVTFILTVNRQNTPKLEDSVN